MRKSAIIVMMGVSGSGKTTVGRALGERLGCAFLEGDDLHPSTNIAKMRAGLALDDDDRAPWLALVAEWIAERVRADELAVVSCSALKRAYRHQLGAVGAGNVRFVMLQASPATIVDRMERRGGHFMPASLLESQIATLELPTPDECALVLQPGLDVPQTCDAIMHWLGVPQSH